MSKRIDTLNSHRVVLAKNNHACYPSSRPFNPSERYPEYPFGGEVSNEKNYVYEMVRDMFCHYGFDNENYGTLNWNPLGTIIKPGDKVLLKPNLVRHYHPYDMDVLSLFTHGSVIRAVLDYVYIALKGRGEIVIGDAPLQNCDFDMIKELTGIDEIKKFYGDKKLNVTLLDFRLVISHINESSIYRDILVKEGTKGDPSGYTRVSLGDKSLLEPVSEHYSDFRVTCYDPVEMTLHHRKEIHEYIIPNTVLQADVIINLPKMKTHRKAGVTGAMKNLIGINGHKDWLPHHRKGAKHSSGDEYLNESYLKRVHSWITDRKEVSKNLMLKKTLIVVKKVFYELARNISGDSFFEGSWWGNDTLWRTINDLNKVPLYADKNGNLTNSLQRNVICITDGITAGEVDGPLAPTPKQCGIMLCGFNPVAVDTVMSRIMGFDFRKIPQINNAYSASAYSLTGFLPDEIEIILGDDKTVNLDSIPESYISKFIPSDGWLYHIEL